MKAREFTAAPKAMARLNCAGRPALMAAWSAQKAFALGPTPSSKARCWLKKKSSLRQACALACLIHQLPSARHAFALRRIAPLMEHFGPELKAEWRSNVSFRSVFTGFALHIQSLCANGQHGICVGELPGVRWSAGASDQ